MIRIYEAVVVLIAVTLTPDDNDTLLATCPEIPEVASFGETEAEALEKVREAILFALDIRIRKREAVPDFRRPRKGFPAVELGSRVAMKLSVYQAMRHAKWRKADLARAMNVLPSDIDRLLNLRYNTGLDQLDAALAAQGLVADVRVMPMRKTRRSAPHPVVAGATRS